MDTKSYINEDFETLLVQKSFDQLLPEEKSFVLHTWNQAKNMINCASCIYRSLIWDRMTKISHLTLV